ncbi:aldehyde dehydrogenase family protein [Nocardia sp. NPDC004750]
MLLPAMRAALPGWRAAGPSTRAEVCVEILQRLQERAVEFAHIAMHTSGRGFPMGLHAGSAHALDRGLEAVAQALAEQVRVPATARWARGRSVMVKEFRVVPVGIAQVLGSDTFPVWHGYPGLFASLAAGNPVLVKPHRAAVLPLAATVRTAREVLAARGFDPDLVCLAPEWPGEGLGKILAARPEIRLVDYAGNCVLGDWLRSSVHHARVRVHRDGCNIVLVESTEDYRGMIANLAFTLCLYSGQLPGSPRVVVVPRAGIGTDEGHKPYPVVLDDLGTAVEDL